MTPCIYRPIVVPYSLPASASIRMASLAQASPGLKTNSAASATTADDGVASNPMSVVSTLVIDSAWMMLSTPPRQARTYDPRFLKPPQHSNSSGGRRQ